MRRKEKKEKRNDSFPFSILHSDLKVELMDVSHTSVPLFNQLTFQDVSVLVGFSSLFFDFFELNFSLCPLESTASSSLPVRFSSFFLSFFAEDLHISSVISGLFSVISGLF